MIISLSNIDLPIIKVLNGSYLILDNAAIITNLSLRNNGVQNISYNPFSITNMDGIIGFLDVIIDDIYHPIDIQYDIECNNPCTQIYSSWNHIHQFHVDCRDINQSETSELISLVDNNLELVNYTTPTRLYLNSSGEFFPGGPLYIDFKIFESQNNEIVHYFDDIFVTLSSEEFMFETVMEITFDLNTSSYKCGICDTGLFIQNASSRSFISWCRH